MDLSPEENNVPFSAAMKNNVGTGHCNYPVMAFVQESPGANTQAASRAEARESLREAEALVLEAHRELSEATWAG